MIFLKKVKQVVGALWRTTGGYGDGGTVGRGGDRRCERCRNASNDIQGLDQEGQDGNQGQRGQRRQEEINANAEGEGKEEIDPVVGGGFLFHSEDFREDSHGDGFQKIETWDR